MSITLITDRTSADTMRRVALRERIKARTATGAEWSEWLNGMKGAYNATDLNRVEAAVEYLKEQFNNLPDVLGAYLDSLGVGRDVFFEVPYSYPLPIETKTNWVNVDTQNKSDMTRYLSNVSALRDVLALPDNTPTLPADMKKLKVDGANDIEKVLRIVNDATLALEALKKMYADNTAAAFWYSGELFSGETYAQGG